MQVLPKFVSVGQGNEAPVDFLAETIADPGLLASLTFLKGYQWPFDVRKARSGSSLIDLLVYRETVLRGRRVMLDFRANDLDVDTLQPQAREYLGRAVALSGNPVQRLRRMNEPAYRLYLDKGVDLEKEMLEVAVCAQHNNAGLAVDSWWQSNIAGLFPVGPILLA
jgi:succinate dehydrogenase/fumarate reductase flavoprotein subunit